MCKADATCLEGLRCIGDEAIGETLICEIEEPDPCEDPLPPTPNEEDFRTMDACETPILCEDGSGGAVSPCVLAAIRDGTVGRLRVEYGGGSQYSVFHIWISVEGDARVTEVAYDYWADCTGFETWGELRRCDLVDPQWFDDCPADACRDPANWFLACEPAEPSCG